jgi:hypothetical protein
MGLSFLRKLPWLRLLGKYLLHLQFIFVGLKESERLSLATISKVKDGIHLLMM